jgi:membrane protein
MSQPGVVLGLLEQMDRATVLRLLQNTARKWNDHNAPSLGASLAYYALLSLAPLVVLLVALCGIVLNRSTAEYDLIAQARQLAGDSAANTLRAVLSSSNHAKGGIIASSVAIATLLFGASGVFVELRQTLNTIWDAPPDSSGVTNFLLQRLATFVMVLVLGFLLLSSLLVSAALGVGERYFIAFLPAGTALVSEAVNVVFSLFAMTVLFGLIFKFVPNVPINWRDVVIGAFVTAVLFTIGRGLLAFYLSTAGIGSTYGAAGSLVALVVWVYYSAQIFFFGAVFTRVYADSVRSPNARGTAAGIR